MPGRFANRDIEETVGFDELRGEVSLETHLEVMNIWVEFKATRMDITWVGEKEGWGNP